MRAPRLSQSVGLCFFNGDDQMTDRCRPRPSSSGWRLPTIKLCSLRARAPPVWTCGVRPNASCSLPKTPSAPMLPRCGGGGGAVARGGGFRSLLALLSPHFRDGWKEIFPTSTRRGCGDPNVALGSPAPTPSPRPSTCYRCVFLEGKCCCSVCVG